MAESMAKNMMKNFIGEVVGYGIWALLFALFAFDAVGEDLKYDCYYLVEDNFGLVTEEQIKKSPFPDAVNVTKNYNFALQFGFWLNLISLLVFSPIKFMLLRGARDKVMAGDMSAMNRPNCCSGCISLAHLILIVIIFVVRFGHD
eukprot:UN04231